MDKLFKKDKKEREIGQGRSETRRTRKEDKLDQLDKKDKNGRKIGQVKQERQGRKQIGQVKQERQEGKKNWTSEKRKTRTEDESGKSSSKRWPHHHHHQQLKMIGGLDSGTSRRSSLTSPFPVSAKKRSRLTKSFSLHPLRYFTICVPFPP